MAIMFLVAIGESVSGDEMTVCQNKTKHPDGYGEYSEEIKSFIKGKNPPMVSGKAIILNSSAFNF